MLHLHDSKNAHVQPLTPVAPGKVGIHLRGATVQGSPHVGHLYAAVSFDTLIRWLRHSGYEATYIRNAADIDDKILHRSAETGRDWRAWAYRLEREFTQAYGTLSVQTPTHGPRVIGHIPKQLDLVQSLIDADHAYSDGHGNVYFNVYSQADYGSSTRRRLADMRTTEDDAQTGEAVGAGKRGPRDFALWKATKPGEPTTTSWDSPWRRGRPGRHLERSAMLYRYLGDEFDIHGDGIDLRFPHHENEQAQSHGTGWELAHLWVYNVWITTKGKKMSRSPGNVLSIRTFTEEYSAVTVCWALSTAHHCFSIEWGVEMLPTAHAAWKKFSALVTHAVKTAGEAPASKVVLAPVDLPEAFVAAMGGDLNVVGALTVLHERLKAGDAAFAAGNVSGVYREQIPVRPMLDVLGLSPASEQWRGRTDIGAGASGAAVAEYSAPDTLVQAVLGGRAAACAARDWTRADELRNRLVVTGVTVADGCDGATWSVG